MSVNQATKTPFLSVVIRSKDEADRLRLVLASLAYQTADCEIIVVDDGSSDHTGTVLACASKNLPLKVVRHETAQGRSAASNAGGQAASGEVLLFLDGDTLAAPDLLARHMAGHARSDNQIFRGDPHHLRCTRFFRNPETGEAWPQRRDELARRPAAEVDEMRVTLAQVVQDFSTIEERAMPGIYPGVGPRRLYELETDALLNAPDCTVLWAASSGSNMSVRRDAFLEQGGFDARLDNNEHRELALRLFKAGIRMAALPGARSYHLTHQIGWRDPLKKSDWETVFLRAQPLPAVALLPIFWATLSSASLVPADYQIHSLPELETAARGTNGLDYDIARRAIGFAPLGPGFWQSVETSVPDKVLPGGMA